MENGVWERHVFHLGSIVPRRHFCMLEPGSSPFDPPLISAFFTMWERKYSARGVLANSNVGTKLGENGFRVWWGRCTDATSSWRYEY